MHLICGGGGGGGVGEVGLMVCTVQCIILECTGSISHCVRKRDSLDTHLHYKLWIVAFSI